VKHFLSYAVLLTAGFSCACSNRADLAPDVAASIRKSLDQSGVKGVSVSQDRTKGVVTLGGNVATADEKSRAESLARSLAANQVVADEIAVIPAGDTSATRTMYSDLDKGIENNLDAALIAGGFRSGIHHTVKNGVVTLTGSVNDEAQRNQVTQIAQGVPNTQQVVNELETTHTKATASR
jgi:hyperosmotically inducible protein